MTSRTPIRLTPHRGPLATPSTSPESSPTLSNSPTNISDYSTPIRSPLDIVLLRRRISTLSSPSTRHQSRSRFYRRRREGTRSGLFGHGTPLSPLGRALERLVYSIYELGKATAGIVAFCLLLWGALEWSSQTSELPLQTNPWMLVRESPLSGLVRVLRCHVNPSHCGSRDQHVAVLQFLSEQIQHAKALSLLSVGIGLPLRAFFEAHRATIPRVLVRHNLPEPLHFLHEVDTLANLTEFLDSPLLEFSSGSFIGRSLALALEELDDLIREPMAPYDPETRESHRDAHLHAIYWRTTSNLLLEYSAARPRARKLLQHLRALQLQLSLLVPGHHTTESDEARLKIWWWNGIARHPSFVEDGMHAFVSGLEVTLGNVRRLIAYLDWITDRLARTTLRHVLKTRRRTDFASCMASLQGLFAQSSPLTSTKSCFCLSDYKFTSSSRPERVEIMVPGSPTVWAGR